METDVTQLSTTIWLAWALIGLIGGYMAGRPAQRGSGYTCIAVLVGMAAAIAGGWGYTEIFGAGDRSEYISLISSVAVTAIVLWIFMSLTAGKPSD